MRVRSTWFKALVLLVFVLPMLALGMSLNTETTLADPDELHEYHEQKGNVELVVREPLSGVPCLAGFAGPYPCQNVDLLSFIPLNTMVGSTGADIWGWTDPVTGKEYAIASHGSSVSFVDISDPTLPVLVGNLPAPITNVLYRDVKVYNNHAYIVGDGFTDLQHGIQVFDLTQLRDVEVTPVVFTASGHYLGFSRAHNIAINEETGFAYVVGTRACNGLYMLDLKADPTNPEFVGCYEGDGYTHDAQCVVYRGPHEAYRGRELCFSANEDTLTIIDVTDKANPALLGRQSYEGYGYTHQGSLTEDHKYFVLGDELDELLDLFREETVRTKTYVWDVSDLLNPAHIGTYRANNSAIDHNMYVRDGFVFQSNYTSGLRILETGNIAQGELSEVGFFDTHPADDSTNFAGTWSNYAFYESGIVAVNNIEDGLYIVKPNLPARPFRAGEASGEGWLENREGEQIRFDFAATKSDAGTSGNLSLSDGEVAIEVTNVTSMGNVSSTCGSVSSGQDSLEFHGSGTYNGVAAEFRVCVQDTHTPGKGLDRFYLECQSGCDYRSTDRAEDDVIEKGNVKIKRRDS